MISFSRLGKYGRFGNQLFEYATLYSVAKKNGYDFGVPYFQKSTNEYENFCLDQAFERLSAKDIKNFIPSHMFLERTNFFDASIFEIPDNTDILGYFQTEKYFKNYRKEILNEFRFKTEIVEKANDVFKQLSMTGISVHLRLGDYVPQQHNYPICDINYYSAALEHFDKNEQLIVFSDEPEKAKNLFSRLNRSYFVVEKNNKFIDMCIMAMCKNHIIANSSFSWWGAWLSDMNKVIAPKKWYNENSQVGMPKKWDDIYCEGWIII